MISTSSSIESINMKIVFAGTPTNAAETLRQLANNGHDIVAVLTREDAVSGRNRELKQSPVAATAKALGIPVLKANRVSEQLIHDVAKFEADIGVVVAYGLIMPHTLLDVPRLGWYNLHYSLLPKYRGAAPVQAALLNGDAETGVTLFKLDEGMDTGDIVGIVNTIIEPEESSAELLQRLTQLGISLALQELPRLFSETVILLKQNGNPTYAHKITRAQAKVNFSQPASEVANLVRAMNPEPMAWFMYDEVPIRIIRAKEVTNLQNLKPAELATTPVVSIGFANSSALELIEVQPQGKRVMAAVDWARGLRNIGVLS